MTLQKAIDLFFKYCSENHLEVNKLKCKIMSFPLKRQIIRFDYILDNESIDRVDEIRDLGVILDPKLKFNKHIEIITKKQKQWCSL